MPGPTLKVQRIYVKNASIENPNSPEIFKKQENPVDEVRIEKKHSVLESESNHYEVIFDLTITTKIGEEVLSITKVRQAGIFKIENTTNEQLDQILQTECLNTLYPHAMQKASDLSVWSTYRPIIMRPMNFYQVYQQLKGQGGNRGKKKEEEEEKDKNKGKSERRAN